MNPHQEDWSEAAFQRIRHKMPKDALPVGCREEDQRVYRTLVQKIDGVNVAEHLEDSRRTCFPSERCLRKNQGQRIDHLIAERSLLEDSEPVRIGSFEVLQQFGGSKKGSPDHCPLWFTIERNPKAVAMATDEEDAPQLEEEVVQMIKDIVSGKPEFKELEMSAEFKDAESDDESLEDDDVTCIHDEDDNRPFEDCPMPMLRCAVYAGAELIPVKMLIDSGSALDLVSGRMARTLARKGCGAKKTSYNIRRVFSRRRCPFSYSLAL